MSRERWFRGDREGQERPFDWYTLAQERDIPLAQAQALYEGALCRAQGAPGHAEALYIELLEAARQEAWRPSPGKVTRTMRLAAERAGKRRRKGPIAPGKRTLTSYLEPPARERRNANPVASDAASTAAPPALERSGPGTAAHRRLRANLLAAHGHFEELDALEQEEPAPLPEDTRARMERAFGHGFHDVRVHAGSPRAAGSTRALTQGRDIHFARDRYAPGTEQGDWLIAHELAHVVQQTAAPGREADKRIREAEADRAAGDAVAGRRSTVAHAATMGAVQAFADDEDHDTAVPAPDAPEPAVEPAEQRVSSRPSRRPSARTRSKTRSKTRRAMSISRPSSTRSRPRAAVRARAPRQRAVAAVARCPTRPSNQRPRCHSASPKRRWPACRGRDPIASPGPWAASRQRPAAM